MSIVITGHTHSDNLFSELLRIVLFKYDSVFSLGDFNIHVIKSIHANLHISSEAWFICIYVHTYLPYLLLLHYFTFVIDHFCDAVLIVHLLFLLFLYLIAFIVL